MIRRCLFFGCWNVPGHYLFVPGGSWAYSAGLGDRPEWYDRSANGDRKHLDGTLAPRRHRHGRLCWQGMGATAARRQRIAYESDEYPQGQFLRHELDSGFTAIQWWDRCQGDKRGACNSTVLLEGLHASAEMLAALRQHFPHVLANLDEAGVALAEIERANLLEIAQESKS